MKFRPLSFLLTSLCAVVFISSCKKPDVEPEKPVLSSKDPQAISAAVKVWHGERVQGTAPTPRGSGLELDASNAAPITLAFAGRYAIIDPEVMQGDVAGYYLQFNGAKEHFKIDYSKPRGGRLRPNTKIPSPFGHQSRQASTQNGNADSSIVIVLPANLKVPDTFCVSYCAYDVQGNISNVITTCIVVNSLGTDANGSYLHGTWKNTASWDTSSVNRDTVIYNKWVSDPYQIGYVCRQDQNGNMVLDYNTFGNPSLVTDSFFHIKNHLSFGTNGGLAYAFHDKYKYIDLPSSTCSQYTFVNAPDVVDNFTGAWNYNSSSGKMVLVFEFNDAGIPALEAWEYKVVKVNNNNIVLIDDAFGYSYYIRFEK